MPKSNAPLALSVVTLTEPDNVEATFNNITRFDGRSFGFNHDQTWAALPLCLKGRITPEAIVGTFSKSPIRIQRCIIGLCAYGQEAKLDTYSFSDYPSSGLKAISSIDWDPEVQVRVKASCWYVSEGAVILPVLQPRKARVSDERLGVYARLVRQAYCQGDWLDTQVSIIDLSGENDTVSVSVIRESELPVISDTLLGKYVKTFVDAKKLADEHRREHAVKEMSDLPMDDYFSS